MWNRLGACVVLGLLAVAVAYGASFERAEEHYLSGDLDSARAELEELLEGDAAADTRASALELLGQIAIDRQEWSAALDAWGELTEDHALTPQAAAVSAAIRPLQALVERAEAAGSGGERPAPQPFAESQRARPLPLPVEEPRSARPAPPVAPAADGTLLVGGWGPEYEASLEATGKIVEFLDANGVRVRPASTEVPAVRGEEVVLSYLLEEAREIGASGVVFITTRFNFREYIEVRGFDPNGARLWRDKLVGGTALKERRDRDKPSWGLVERALKQLSKRLGTPDLPTG